MEDAVDEEKMIWLRNTLTFRGCQATETIYHQPHGDDDHEIPLSLASSSQKLALIIPDLRLSYIVGSVRS